jgi:hypothetical protein
LNSACWFRLVTAPSYLLKTVIWVFVTQGVTHRWDQPNILPIDLNRSKLSLLPFLDISVYRARNVIITSYVLSNLTTTIYLSILKKKLILIFWSLVSKNHRLYNKTHVNYDFLNALSGKSLISRSANSYLLTTYNLILDILLSQYKLNLNHYVFGMNKQLVVIGVKYRQRIPAVWFMWIFKADFHS